MKKMLFLMLFLLILGAANVNSQVRIGGNEAPHGAAVLDLNATDGTNNGTKGLALPRVSLSSNTVQITSGTANLSGMLVYNTNTALGAGVYYWDGSKWAKVTDGSTDANTIYSGSTSITLSGTSFQRAALTGDVTAPANSNATTIANGVVTNAKIANGAVDSAKIAANAIRTTHINNNAVTSAKIADGTVATADLANGAVTAVKLNQMAATSGQVLKWNGTAWAPAADANDNTNTTYKGSTSVRLVADSLVRAALTGDVTAAQNTNATTIANGAVTNAKIANGAVDSAKIAANAIRSTHIINNAVTSAKIADGAVATADLANGAVTAAKLNQMAATSGQVLKWNGTAWAPAADDNDNTNTTYTGSTSVTLSGTSFQRAALTGDVTAAANSNATAISAGAVTAAKIAASAVGYSKIQIIRGSNAFDIPSGTGIYLAIATLPTDWQYRCQFLPNRDVQIQINSITSKELLVDNTTTQRLTGSIYWWCIGD